VKFAAGILGIIAGAWTFFMSFYLIVVGSIIGLIGPTYIPTIAIIALNFSVIGAFGGLLAFFKPRIGGYVMLIGSVGAIILTVVFAINGEASVITILPMVALIAGGVLALAKGR
jgi:hypothetical protein